MRFAGLGFLLVSLSSVIVPTAFALGSLPSSPTSPSEFVKLICRLAGWLFTFLILLAIVFIIVAAYNYMTSAGDSEKVATAHRMIAYTAVAIIVAMVARGVPIIVVETLLSSGSASGLPTC